VNTGKWQNGNSDNVVNHPGINPKNRRIFQVSRSKLPLIVVGLLLLYVSISLSSRFDSLYTMQRDLQDVQAQVKQLRQVNSDLSQQLELMRSDAYVEQVAREKLGLVKPGETRIVPVNPDPAGTSSQAPAKAKGAKVND